METTNGQTDLKNFNRIENEIRYAQAECNRAQFNAIDYDSPASKAVAIGKQMNALDSTLDSLCDLADVIKEKREALYKLRQFLYTSYDEPFVKGQQAGQQEAAIEAIDTRINNLSMQVLKALLGGQG